jgi:molybdopterin converting factor small subunit
VDAMITLRIFGDLAKTREKHTNITSPKILEVDPSDIKIVNDILKKFNLTKDEVSHIFVNGIYSGLKKKVNDGDRVALFPRNMGLLYKWYFTKVDDD